MKAVGKINPKTAHLALMHWQKSLRFAYFSGEIFISIASCGWKDGPRVRRFLFCKNFGEFVVIKTFTTKNRKSYKSSPLKNANFTKNHQFYSVYRKNMRVLWVNIFHCYSLQLLHCFLHKTSTRVIHSHRGTLNPSYCFFFDKLRAKRASMR